MSSKSNDNGRAFEYACILALKRKIELFRSVDIIRNSCLEANINAWNNIDTNVQSILNIAANSMVDDIINLEPNLIENDGETMTMRFQKDQKGVSGDVRDIVVERSNIQWEIGFSVKHQHEALKHCRIGRSLDFGNEWYGIPCSKEYWNAVTPIFRKLEVEKENKTKWSEIPAKKDTVYLPLLNAFMDEISRANRNDPKMIKRMMTYLVGNKDYHKIISKDNKRITLIRTFNISGDLNKPSKSAVSNVVVPIVNLPSDLISIRLKPKNKTTVEMYLNEGWQLSFRIHSAETLVQTSLKFDVQYIGLPATVLCITCKWK